MVGAVADILVPCACSKEEETERQQLGEEIAAEVEELLTYAVDTAPPQQLPPFDFPGVYTAILHKLFASCTPLPGNPVRLLLLSSKVSRPIDRTAGK